MWMRGPQLPGRAERWRQDTCVRDTPTDSRATPCSHVETHARYYWWGLWPIILRTSAHLLLKATAYSNKCNDRKKTQNTVGLVGISQWITRGPSFWREGERKRERERHREEGQRDSSLHQDVLSMWHWRTACQNHCRIYMCLLTAPCIRACTSAHVQYLSITGTSRQSANPTVGMWQHSGGVQWGMGSPVTSESWGCMEAGYWQKIFLTQGSHENIFRTSFLWCNSLTCTDNLRLYTNMLIFLSGVGFYKELACFSSYVLHTLIKTLVQTVPNDH